MSTVTNTYTEYNITTFDNPYDVFDDFTNWFMFDTQAGYYTSGLLARVARTSDQLSDEENQEEIKHAIDEIIKYDFQNIYKRVTREVSYDIVVDS